MKTILNLLWPLTLALALTYTSPASAQTHCGVCSEQYDACAAACEPSGRSGARCIENCKRSFERCVARTGCDEPGDACPVIQSVFDMDVPAVLLRGNFTVNGASPLPYDAHQGRIELRNETLGVVDLGSVHFGSYQAWVVPGIYDVYYLHEQGDILPQNAETLLMEDVSLESGGAWHIDVPSVLVMGDIFIDGAPAPNGFYENGEIRLRDTVTGASFPVGQTWEGAFMAMVVPGTYDVLWRRLLGGSVVPINDDALLMEGVVVDGLTEFSVDVPVIELEGSFTLNGVAPPFSVYENGEILLRDLATGAVVSVGHTRDRAWSARIVPGTYDVLYSRLTGGSVVPANELALLESAVQLDADGVLDVDVPVVTLSGDFRLDGAPFPASFYNNAHLWLRGSQADDLVDLGAGLDGGYELRVVPGSYDVFYNGLSSTGLVPQNPWALIESGAKVPKSKNGTRTLDIDVPSAPLEVVVSMWGEAPPVGFYENGAISLRGADGDAFAIGETRLGGGTARVVEDDYAVHYTHLLGGAMPINGDARIGAATALPLLIPTPVDLQPGLLAGVFSQNGLPFPAAGDYGRFLLRDAVTGDRIVVGESTAGLYDETLLRGTYDVLYDHAEGDGIVANVGAYLGCITFEPLPPWPNFDQTR